jgi:hypothetical protein
MSATRHQSSGCFSVLWKRLYGAGVLKVPFTLLESGLVNEKDPVSNGDVLVMVIDP